MSVATVKAVAILVVFLILAMPVFAIHDTDLVAPVNDSFLGGNNTINITFTGSGNVTIEQNSTGGYQLLNSSPNEASGYTFTWQTNNGSFPDGTYGLRVIVVNSTNQSDNATRFVSNITIDNTNPSFGSSTPAAGAVFEDGQNITVNVSVTDNTISDGTNCFPEIDGNNSSFTGSVLYNLALGTCNGTLTLGNPSGLSSGGHNFSLNVTDQVNHSTSLQVSIGIDNIAPNITVLDATNNSLIDGNGSLRFMMLDTAIGLNLSSLTINTSGANNELLTYSDNTSLFDCTCPQCSQTTAAPGNGYLENFTCLLDLSWSTQGETTFFFTISDDLANANSSFYNFTLVSNPDIINVSINGQVIANDTPSESIAVSVTNAAKEMTFNWTSNTVLSINETKIAFVNDSSPRTVTFTALPGGTVYNVTAGKNYLRINLTLDTSPLIDSIQLNLTANVPLNLTQISNQYVRNMVESWTIYENGVNVTGQNRFMNSTFDIFVNVTNDTEPFTATFNYTGLNGLALRWNHTTDQFKYRMGAASDKSTASFLTVSNVTIMLLHLGQTEKFFDDQSYRTIVTFNFSLGNRTPYFQQRNTTEGNTYLLEACATVPTAIINASDACYVNTTTTTLYLPRFDNLDRIVFSEWDARGPEVLVYTSNVSSQNLVTIDFRVVTPNPNTTLCSYNLSKFNQTSNISTTRITASVLRSQFTLETLGFDYEQNVTNIADGVYNLSITCADTQGHTNSTNKTITVTDTTPPTISNIQQIAITRNEERITGFTDELAVFNISYGITNSSLIFTETGSSTFSTSLSLTLEDLSTGTKYFYQITACDQKNNCNTSSIRSFTTDSPSGGSGGGGGVLDVFSSGIVVPEATDSRVWGNFLAGDEINYSPSGMVIKRVYLKFRNETERVVITIKQFPVNPNITELSGSAYKYFLFEHSGLDDVETYTIEFAVSEEWLSNIVASTLRFYRLEGEWRAYDAEKIGETYQVVLPGFSYFAIAGDVETTSTPPPIENLAPPDETAPPAEVTPPDEEQPATFVSALDGKSGIHPILWILAIVVVAVLLTFFGLQQYKLYQKRELEHKQVLDRDREEYEREKLAGGRLDKPLERVKEHDPMAKLYGYIVKMRKEGYDDEHIKKRLVSVGWDVVIVEQELLRK